MRRAYQKAVAIPLNNVEHLWKEYDQWENNLNRLTAKKFLGEKSSAYMTARTALREMRTLMENVNRGVVPKPPQWTDKEISQLAAWKQYIEWEKSNPLQLEDESMITERVAYAYQQAFLVLRFYPELWYDYAMYYIEHQKPEKALGILKQGVEVLPSSLLLTFAYTELCESKRQLDDARQAFDVLLEHLDKDIEKIKDAAQQEMDKIQQEADEEKNNMNLNDDIDGEIREQLRVRERQVKKDQEEVETKMNEQVDGLAKGCSLVWINYMRFARRTEGIKAARALFSRARKAANRTYHVFIASALMEYHNSKDATIAGKIFGLGLKQFADDPDYISYYLDYLVQMNDDNNTRALFERTLATMPATKAEPIWAKFLDYENKYGDLASIHSVEKRRHEALPDIDMTQSFMERYTYLNIRVIDELELGTEERKSGDGKDAMAQAATSGTGTSGPAATNQANTEQQRGGRSKDQNAKRPLLEPVHPERYPRPDLNQWQSFKPAESSRRPTGTAAANVTSGVTSGASATSAPNISGGPSGRIPPNADSANPPPPMAPPTIPQTKDTVMSSVAPPSQVMGNIPGPQQVQQQQPLPSQQQQQQPPTNNWNTNQQLPEPVAYFVSNLPPAHNFNGPLIQANELAELLRNVIIPLPQGGGPPMRGPQQQQQQQQKPMGAGPSMGAGGRDMPPNRGGYGRGGGRGGFKSRGGGPGRGGRQGVKRRGGRDDFEDDYQQHNKGMGPNRPPAYDVFRARQAKRHRDDPTY
ncbi:hypothetical protein BDC45DRAFT_543564 [Circinella umbellata]|nr:hypothetical protein BDC45DRAFT_543564 [Circinella umbellata]